MPQISSFRYFLQTLVMLFAIAFLAGVLGCSTATTYVWYNPNKNPEVMKQETFQCKCVQIKTKSGENSARWR
jgi:hypothetical protein